MYVFIFSLNFRGYNHEPHHKTLSGRTYAEVSYECDKGYKLADVRHNRLFCSAGEWIGHRPKCVEVVKKDPRPVCPVGSPAKCDHLCFVDTNGRQLCECHPGFKSIH